MVAPGLLNLAAHALWAGADYADVATEFARGFLGPTVGTKRAARNDDGLCRQLRHWAIDRLAIGPAA